MNQVAVLFQDRGFESYVVPADGSGQATFLDRPARTIGIDEYARRLRHEDITIDFWPDKRLMEIASQKKNATRIFWQHGASIPIGGTTVGDAIFRPGNPYTQHWNVSRACAEYFQKHYDLSMPVVHPFFDSPTMREYQQQPPVPREGFLLLARRGQRHLPAIAKKLAGQRVTIMQEPYHERDFFNALLDHTFFVSTDDGIHAPSLVRRTKNKLRALLSKRERKTQRQRNRWFIPEGHLLGFPMPPAEAAWLGCIVIGFAMGGGREWMNEHNCFLAKDGDAISLLTNIDHALAASEDARRCIRTQARLDTARFTSEKTWESLAHLLSL
ncbi:glycosyltransferase [Candidatus Uhrbacteria bacterium]|nr:glycosyltransferase [Candidatus Uhrbacteria bacterium]